jgi:putative SOS response-associated peptidase YedK
MCGRFAFHSPHDTVRQLFLLPADTPELEPRWNIAPHGAWLDPAITDGGRFAGVIADDTAVALSTYPVSRRVNNPRNDGPDLATPATADATDEA